METLQLEWEIVAELLTQSVSASCALLLKLVLQELQLLALLKIVPWPGTSNQGYEQEKGNESTLKHLEGLENFFFRPSLSSSYSIRHVLLFISTLKFCLSNKLCFAY